jgi:hypothetical protein
MISHNACKPEYRNLSPQKEAELRSARLGHPERPGATPHLPTVLSKEAKAAIVDGRAKAKG